MAGVVQCVGGVCFCKLEWGLVAVFGVDVVANMDIYLGHQLSPVLLLAPLPAAIEGRNNQLERHSRNNQALLAALEQLVGRLALPEGAERALQARDVTAAK